MSQFYAAYFPQLTTNENWILDFRKSHDPKYSLVSPHITLFFPTSEFSEMGFFEEMKTNSKNFPTFIARFKTAIMMPEKSTEEIKSTIFLVPDQGFGDIVRLHDRLYCGNMKPFIRLDIPFIPHITIGAGLDLEVAKRLVDEINSKNLDIVMEIDHFEVVKIEHPQTRRLCIARVNLSEL